jgi:hypothetical protein
MNETISFPEEQINIEQRRQYYADAFERIGSGETVWMQRNFDSDTAKYLDLYVDRKPRGYIKQYFFDMSCDVYRLPNDDYQGAPQSLTPYRVGFDDAVELLQKSVL